MNEEEAYAEEARFLSLIEQPPEYEILVTVNSTAWDDEDTGEEMEEWFVGLGWHAWVNGHEIGNAVAIDHTGMSWDNIRNMMERSYQDTRVRFP